MIDVDLGVDSVTLLDSDILFVEVIRASGSLRDYTLEDAAATSDSSTTASAYSITVDEVGLNITDLASGGYLYDRSTSTDILGALDDRLVETSYVRFVDETVIITDTVAAEADISPIDTISVSDQLSPDVQYDRSASDAVSVTDNVTGEPDEGGVDTVVVTDFLLTATQYVRENNDAPSLTDIIATELNATRTASDSIGVSDGFVLVEKTFPQDAVAVTDTTAVSSVYERLPADVDTTVEDSVSPDTNYVRTADEALDLTDTVSFTKFVLYDVLLSDTAVVTDSALAEPTLERQVSDTPIAVTDQVTRDPIVFSRTIDEALTVTDEVIRSTTFPITLGDTVTVTDNVTADTTKERAGSDAISVTDQFTQTTYFERLPTDAVAISDTITAVPSRFNDVSISDTISVTDFALAESIDVDIDVSDTIFAITDQVVPSTTYVRSATDTVGSITESVLAEHAETDRAASDTIAVTDSLSLLGDFIRVLSDAVQTVDVTSVELVSPLPVVMDVDGFGLTITLPEAIRYDNLVPDSLFFKPLAGRGVPFQVEKIEPQVEILSTGLDGSVVYQGGQDYFSAVFSVTTGVFSSSNVNDYLEVSNGLAPGTYRIVGYINSTTVVLEKKLPVVDLANGALSWVLTGAVESLHVTTSNKVTNQQPYEFSTRDLVARDGSPFELRTAFYSSGVLGPRVTGATVTDDGIIEVVYDQPMMQDLAFVGPPEYTLSGPSEVRVLRAWPVAPDTVALDTVGLIEGTYTLSVNYAGTPKDVAGNPIDPTFSQAIFAAPTPTKVRSIFTDKGPIAKPALTLQSGVGATIVTVTEVILPGATLSAGDVGNYLRLGYMGLAPTTSSSVLGTDVTVNDTISTPDAMRLDFVGPLESETLYTSLSGTYKVIGVVSATRAKVQASFSLPEAGNGLFYWELINPRTGEIADDVSDVTVKINGVVTPAAAVVGLLGQVVLNEIPGPDDDVKVDYSWVCNPTVELRRLNSREFRLNSWNRDVGYDANPTQHKYRYNNTLVRPSDYVSLNMLATVEQPEVRELHYRAYERAYTPVLNDPTLLLLNSPIHKIAFPPSQRTVSEEFITYEATVLPENDTSPWIRHGVGAASVLAGVLTLIDNTSGVFPFGQPIFWTREIDLTFPHAFAMSWRFLVNTVPVYDGVFTGIAAGYTDAEAAFVVGFLTVSGTRKIGLLKRGAADDPSLASAWTGGVDVDGNPTGAPVDFDWAILHSYRIFRDLNGVVRVFVDGNVVETLRILPDEAPFLEEVNAPFNEIQGAFFGSLSRASENQSQWDFVRYLILPTNPLQTSPSSFVSYEATIPPEIDAKPWTPVGFHGTETILSNDYLLLDSTSATDASTATEVGLMGGDFKGFVRMEPLLTSASQVVLDINVQLRTYTHGVDPYGLMVAVDDGNRLTQVAFLANMSTPKLSYGGRSLPEDFSPYVWTPMGGGTAEMVGRILRITDSTIGDGKIYVIDDSAPPASDDRVIASTTDYFLEFRVKVESYTPDGSGFAGVTSQVFDGTRSVGLLFAEVTGIRFVYLHSDGITVAPFAFDWNDGEFHTYRLAKSTTGNLVSLFIDGVFVGSAAYSAFTASAPDTAYVAFGSSTPSSAGALSVADWAYCNAWRTRGDIHPYVGIWKGYDPNSLTGYHLPLKTSGTGAQVVGNALGDSTANFIAKSVVAGDVLIVDFGPNKGVYTVAAVSTAQSLTIIGTWPLGPTTVDYRIVQQTDWTVLHKYRLLRDSTGETSLLFENSADPLIRIGYNSIDLPVSGTGIVKTLTNGLAAIAFGSFSPENLEQSYWDYVRYGITRSPTEDRIAPHHQILNQWNVMESPERLYTALPHELTSFKSSSTGIVPKKDPDFLRDPGLPAYTQLNDSTPLVPSTQTFEVRGPFPLQEFVSTLNNPEDVLNNDGDFTLNDGSIRYRLIVPNDVLYSSLDVIEQLTGEENLLAPFGEDCGPQFKGVQYTKEVCLTYDANSNVLPENNTASPTPWTRQSDVPSDVMASVFGGVLTYRTVGSATVYKNNTTLPDAPGLQTEARFRLRLVDDATLGTGDTKVRFGLSAPGLTVALAFVTTPLAERYVLVVDLNNGNYLGSVNFDFLDGAFHDYRIVRDPGAGVVRVFIDS